MQNDVPQESVLGPLLFLIYINDLRPAINYPMVLFADDSTVIFSNRHSNGIHASVKKILIDIIQWLTIII